MQKENENKMREVKVLAKLKLKVLYIITRLHQKIFRDGSFPFKYYSKLTDYVMEYKPATALECGTAVGLTACAITIGNPNLKLDTIEKHVRNIDKAKNNISKFFPGLYKQINFINGKYFEVLESDEYKDKKYDFIFLDAYVSRYNEVLFLSNYLNTGGVFVVSNIREDIEKSVRAKNFLLGEGEFLLSKSFELLGEVEDTIFCKKL